MGGKMATDAETTVRYPEYVEDHHKLYLDSVSALVTAAQAENPFDAYSPIAGDIETAYFGVGYVLTDFPSLYDMFGKFMAGLDVEVLFDEIFEESTQGTIIDNLVSVHASRLSDDLEQEAFPRFATGLRDIGSVMSSSFIVGKAMIEAQRVKEVSKFDAETRYRMIPVAVARWQTHLKWNESVIRMYAEILKQWTTTKVSVDNQDMDIARNDILWPLDVSKYFGEALGALTGASVSTEKSPLSRHILGGALSGAGAGYMLGGPPGAMVGAGLGAVLGLAGAM